jgi:DNA primase large subunit
MSHIFEIEDIVKYPFIKEAREYVKNKGLSIEDIFLTTEFRQILDHAYERIVNAINKGTIPANKRIDPSKIDIEILSFPTAILMISIIGNDALAYKYAVAESKRAIKLFKNENLEKLAYIGESLGWNVEIIEMQGIRYLSIPVTTYISYASSLSGEEWHLSLQNISKGYISLLKKMYIRILGEGVKYHILKLFNPVINIDYSGASEYIERLMKLSEEKFKLSYAITPEMEGISEVYYPPCMRVILGELMSGKNPPHLARFSIVAFLRSIGWKPEETIKLFTRVADFNERITRYQVEHIYGMRGSKIVYNVPSCNTLKASNLCYAGNDPICARIKHPLQYVRYRRGKYHDETKRME